MGAKNGLAYGYIPIGMPIHWPVSGLNIGYGGGGGPATNGIIGIFVDSKIG